ncbi:MAG: 16S rRNA (cytosine(1402)-N(4))-methyltransferase RsmH [Halomonadaceae bacterium]|nr:MAG: 16S rRNA (cytosine(1402)-N(4))-methyltransferase RsmH [Halomonadaceae bacterium]
MTTLREISLNHDAVLLEEAVAQLAIQPAGRYVDGTFGRGGHSRAILSQLGESGALMAVDKDPEAMAVAEQLVVEDPRFSIRRGSFAALPEHLSAQQWDRVDGLLLDLGVSSPQLDDAARGFSFMRQGPLDMRMDPDSGESAAQWLATAEEKTIADVIFQYGEERFSRRIARAIVTQREEELPVATTNELANLVAAAVPKREKGKHPATRTFQAIRIHINRELADLEAVLAAALPALAVNGRLVVISFHSLEDRLVKRFMRDASQGIPAPKGVPVTASEEQTPFRVVGKPVKASREEIARNVRARSAVMRTLERIA